MLLRLVAVTLAASGIAAACTNCTNESPDPIELSPAPWTLHGDVYGVFLLPGLGTPLLGNHLPAKAFPPLERRHPESIAGKFKGKVGMIQVLRYTDSPVGPYDELLIVPGFFGYEDDGSPEEGVRVSRIYVSQKYTAWNGRKSESDAHLKCTAKKWGMEKLTLESRIADWNIPKHLARFDWTYSASGAATVKVYPFDTNPNDPLESRPAEKPFFQMTFAPLHTDSLLDSTLSFLPPGAIPPGIDLALDLTGPFSTDLFKILGINATLVQPPVPASADSFGAITDGGPGWKSVVPGQYTNKASLGLMNMDQSGGDGEAEGENAVGDEFYRNFWPGLLPVNLGVKLEDAVITFGDPVDMPGVVAK